MPLRARTLPRPHLQDGDSEGSPSYLHQWEDSVGRGQVTVADLPGLHQDLPPALQVQEAVELGPGGSRKEADLEVEVTH